MWSPQHSKSPRPSPYILRPVPIRRSLAAEAASTNSSLFSPTPSTSSRSPSSFFTHSPVQVPSPLSQNNSPIATSPSPSPSQSTNYSNGGFLMKPQLLKKSPFANFPAGVATSHPTPPKSVQPTVTITPLPKHQFEKWSTSIKSWSPTPQPPKNPHMVTPTTRSTPSKLPPPQPPQSPAQEPNRMILQSSVFSPSSNHTFGSPAIFPNEQSVNLTQPKSTPYRSPPRAPSSSSICTFSTPTPCSPAFPLDIPSPPPLAPPQSTPSQTFFGPPASVQPNSQQIFRLNPKDRSIVAMTPNDKALIEATQQLDSMNLANQHPRSTFNRQAPTPTPSIGNPTPGPCQQQSNKSPTPAPTNMTMDTSNVASGIFCSDDNRITLHYQKPQRPTQPPPLPPQPKPQPPPRKVQPCDPQPKLQAFRGLSTKVIEGSFSDVTTDKLEENYLKCRNTVMSKEGYLITPLRFLSTLSDRMGINYHSETCQFNNVLGPNDKQYRTEIYFGGFCGVAHALSVGFSRQLAAAHVLERMRIHFRGIKQTNYALYPGNRYTRIEEKLRSLCERFCLGDVQLAVKDRRRYNNGGGGRMWKRGWGGGDLEVKWECSCFVRKLMATVLSDDQLFGSYNAMKEMYWNFVQPTDVPAVQLKDYFAIGVDCPMFRDIHCSLLLHRPSAEKIMWMEEYGVPSTQIDAVLNDPRNNSGYLLGAPMAWKRRQNWRSTDEMENRFMRFKEQLEEALEWMQGAYRRRNNLLGGARFRQPGGRQNGEGIGGGRIVEEVAMETGNSGGDLDAEDLEVEEIFHDACMEI